MNTEPNELLYFHYCRTLDGSLVPVDTAKQNGRLIPRFSPGQFEPVDDDAGSELDELVAEVCQGLTAVERRTWLQLIDGVTVLDIAVSEGVSRSAIYERIRGNSRGQGGMIAKNEYVAIWWRLRQQREAGQ